ncbi:MAG TPA: hypothetical protein VFC17_05115 [Candidatus Limnocylindrales bacterium]|nr:hypothetical protein [Candidatus Limnocylindrales bacterium]
MKNTTGGSMMVSAPPISGVHQFSPKTGFSLKIEFFSIPGVLLPLLKPPGLTSDNLTGLYHD